MSITIVTIIIVVILIFVVAGYNKKKKTKRDTGETTSRAIRKDKTNDKP